MADMAPEHTVVLYASGFCEFSEMVRLHLESRGQPYDERDVDRDPAAREEMMRFGGMGTPVTVIDGEVVIGFDDAAIDELLGFEPYHDERGALDGPTMSGEDPLVDSF